MNPLPFFKHGERVRIEYAPQPGFAEEAIVGGAVSTLYITDGTVNLLQGMQSQMAAAGLGSAMADMAGGVANAVMVAMYEGESLQHFGCCIGEQMVIGTFPGVGFKDPVSCQAAAFTPQTIAAAVLVTAWAGARRGAGDLPAPPTRQQE